MKHLGYLLIIASIALPSVLGCSKHPHRVHWGYEGKYGPEYWGSIKAEYALCQDGKNQSPVNITAAVLHRPGRPWKSNAQHFFNWAATSLH